LYNVASRWLHLKELFWALPFPEVPISGPVPNIHVL